MDGQGSDKMDPLVGTVEMVSLTRKRAKDLADRIAGEKPLKKDMPEGETVCNSFADRVQGALNEVMSITNEINQALCHIEESLLRVGL